MYCKQSVEWLAPESGWSIKFKYDKIESAGFLFAWNYYLECVCAASKKKKRERRYACTLA